MNHVKSLQTPEKSQRTQRCWEEKYEDLGKYVKLETFANEGAIWGFGLEVTLSEPKTDAVRHLHTAATLRRCSWVVTGQTSRNQRDRTKS